MSSIYKQIQKEIVPKYPQDSRSTRVLPSSSFCQHLSPWTSGWAQNPKENRSDSTNRAPTLFFSSNYKQILKGNRPQISPGLPKHKNPPHFANICPFGPQYGPNLPTCPSALLPSCPSAHLPTCPPAHLPICPPAHRSICPSGANGPMGRWAGGQMAPWHYVNGQPVNNGLRPNGPMANGPRPSGPMASVMERMGGMGGMAGMGGMGRTVCASVCLCVCVWLRLCVCVCVCVCLCVCVLVLNINISYEYVYIYIYICIYLHIDTYIIFLQPGDDDSSIHSWRCAARGCAHKG